MSLDQSVTCEVQVACDVPCALGENPLWVADTGCLLWTDIVGGKLHQLQPSSGKHEVIYQGRPVGGFTLQNDGSLLLFKDRGTITRWTSTGEHTLIEEIPEERNLRFNDVIVDPAGRVFCGTYADGQLGRLYRLDTNGTLTKLLEGIGCSNGMAFSQDRKQLFYIDSLAWRVYQFDYDYETGSISGQRVFYTVPVEDGLPDGCTLDAEGHLWIAFWDGACIKRIGPDGHVAQLISVPTKKVTSLAFGGPELRDVYITSAGGDERCDTDPLAGALFHFKSEQRGVPEYKSRIERPKGTV